MLELRAGVHTHGRGADAATAETSAMLFVYYSVYSVLASYGSTGGHSQSTVNRAVPSGHEVTVPTGSSREGVAVKRRNENNPNGQLRFHCPKISHTTGVIMGVTSVWSPQTGSGDML